MRITLNAPDGLQVMFIGFVARDEYGCLFASQHCAAEDEIKDGATIMLKESTKEAT